MRTVPGRAARLVRAFLRGLRPADSPILTASSPGHGFSTSLLRMFIKYEHGPGRRDQRRSEQPRFIHREISMRFEESVEQASEEIIDWVDWDRFLESRSNPGFRQSSWYASFRRSVDGWKNFGTVLKDG